MKRSILILLCILLAFTLVGCKNKTEVVSSAGSDDAVKELPDVFDQDTIKKPQIEDLDFNAHYIRIDSSYEPTDTVTLIRSAGGFPGPHTFDMTAEYDGVSYNSYMKDLYYSTEFFKDKMIFFFVVQQPSGSYRNEVTRVTRDETGKTAVYVKTIAPEWGTDDIANWAIIVEVEKYDISGCFFHVDKVSNTPAQHVRYYKDFVGISLDLPEGWNYKEIVLDSSPVEHQFGIEIWPDDFSENGLQIVYNPTSLGLCGTGLVSEDVIVGKYQVSLYSYGGYPFDFATFSTNCDGYMMNTNFTVCDWWETRQDELKEIFDSLSLVDIGITKEDAIELAKEHTDIYYSGVVASYDYKKGSFEVTFRNADSTAVVYVNESGVVE